MTWMRTEDRVKPTRSVCLPDPLPCDRDRCVGMLVKAMLAGDQERVAEIMAHDGWHQDVVWERNVDRARREAIRRDGLACRFCGRTTTSPRAGDRGTASRAFTHVGDDVVVTCRQCNGLFHKGHLTAGDLRPAVRLERHNAGERDRRDGDDLNPDVVWRRGVDRNRRRLREEDGPVGRVLKQRDDDGGGDAEVLHVRGQFHSHGLASAELVEEVPSLALAALDGVPVDAQPHGRTSALVRLLRTVARRVRGGER